MVVILNVFSVILESCLLTIVVHFLFFLNICLFLLNTDNISIWWPYRISFCGRKYRGSCFPCCITINSRIWGINKFRSYSLSCFSFLFHIHVYNYLLLSFANVNSLVLSISCFALSELVVFSFGLYPIVSSVPHSH